MATSLLFFDRELHINPEASQKVKSLLHTLRMQAIRYGRVTYRQMDSIAHVSRFFYVYFTLAIAAIILMLAAPFDYEFTALLSHYPKREWVSFFRQSIFEKGRLGYTDFGIFFYLLTIGTYIFCHIGSRERWPLVTKYSGYLLAAGLLVGVVMVHGIKLALGRARPHQVLSGEHPFTAWHELGPLNSFAGGGTGSFPSGHTATTLWMLALWFLIERHTWKKHRRSINWLSALWLAAALVQALVTGATRSLTADHWLTDWLAAVFMGLALITYCYRALIHYAPEPTPRYFEIKWAGRRIALGVVLACSFAGLRLISQS